MGTNYYFFPKGFGVCECCGAELPRLHIGKQSAGWVFMLHGIDNDKLSLRSWADWREHIASVVLENPKAVIVSDYDACVSLEDLDRLVMKPTNGLLRDRRFIAVGLPYDITFTTFC